MARTQGLGPSSANAQTGAYTPGAKAPGFRLGKLGGGGTLGPGMALLVLVILEAGVQIVFRTYFRRAHGG